MINERRNEVNDAEVVLYHATVWLTVVVMALRDPSDL